MRHIVLAAISPTTTIVIVVILIIAALFVSLWLYRLSRRPLLRRCPYCQAVMQEGSNFCPNCGKEVPETTTVIVEETRG